MAVGTVGERRGDNVRIGPVSIITLIAVICMAALAVLTASTANATAAISQRQANATQLMYVNETAGQEFIAKVDDVLISARAENKSANGAVEGALDQICQEIRDAHADRVSITATYKDDVITAELVCDNTRRLTIVISIKNDGTYRIEKWKSAAVQQEAQPAGSLWNGA